MKIEMSVFDRKPLLLIKNSMYVGHHRSDRACVSLHTGRFLTRWGEVCFRSGTNNESLEAPCRPIGIDLEQDLGTG